jgi:hypothetical protein
MSYVAEGLMGSLLAVILCMFVIHHKITFPVDGLQSQFIYQINVFKTHPVFLNHCLWNPFL